MACWPWSTAGALWRSATDHLLPREVHERLYAWADRNERLRLLRTETTNDAALIAQHPRMVSINTALQVDLFGQANASRIGGHHPAAGLRRADRLHRGSAPRGRGTGPDGSGVLAPQGRRLGDHPAHRRAGDLLPAHRRGHRAGRGRVSGATTSAARPRSSSTGQRTLASGTSCQKKPAHSAWLNRHLSGRPHRDLLPCSVARSSTDAGGMNTNDMYPSATSSPAECWDLRPAGGGRPAGHRRSTGTRRSSRSTTSWTTGPSSSRTAAGTKLDTAAVRRGGVRGRRLRLGRQPPPWSVVFKGYAVQEISNQDDVIDVDVPAAVPVACGSQG